MFLQDLYNPESIEKFNDLYSTLSIKKDFNSFIKDILCKIEKDIDEYDDKNDPSILKNKKLSIRKIKEKLFMKFISITLSNPPTIPKNLNLKVLDEIYNQIINMKNFELNKNAPKHLINAYNFYSNLDDIKRFKRAYGFDNFDSFFINQVYEMYIWVTDNSPIVFFPYIKDCITEKKIIANLTKDIELTFIKKYKNTDYYSLLSVSPIDSIPYDPSNRIKTSNTVSLEDGSQFYTYVHNINDNERYTILIRITDKEQLKTETSSMKIFNAFDYKVCRTLLKISSGDFFSKEESVLDLDEFIKLVYHNNNEKQYKIGGKQYNDVIASLKKLDSFKLIYENDKGAYNPLEICDIVIKAERCKKYTKRTVSYSFKKQYINKLLEGVVLMDDNISLNSIYSNSLLGPLASARYKAFGENKEKVILGFHTYFNATLLLGKSNKSKKIKLIHEGLKELEEKQIIIKSVNKQKDNFIVEFLPLNDDEKDKITKSLEAYEKKGLNLTLPFKL